MNEPAFLTVDEIEYYDRSTVEDYITCPSQGRLKKEFVPLTCSAATESGQEAHNVFGAGMLARWEGATLNEVREIMRDEMNRSRPDVQPDVIDACKRYLFKFAENLYFTPAGYDRNPEDIVAFDGGTGDKSGQLACKMTEKHGLTCEVDLLLRGETDGEMELHDWKSGRTHWTSGDVKTSFQFGTFYPYLVFRNFKHINRIHVIIHMPRKYEQTSPVTFHRSDEAAMNERLLRGLEIMQGDCLEVWPTKEKCGWCDVLDHCSMKQAVKVKASNKDLLNSYVIYSTYLDEIKKELKKAVDTDGEISIVNEAGETISYGIDKPAAKRKRTMSVY